MLQSAIFEFENRSGGSSSIAACAARTWRFSDYLIEHRASSRLQRKRSTVNFKERNGSTTFIMSVVLSASLPAPQSHDILQPVNQLNSLTFYLQHAFNPQVCRLNLQHTRQRPSGITSATWLPQPYITGTQRWHPHWHSISAFE